MGSIDADTNDVCMLLSRLQSTDADVVFNEARTGAESVLMPAISQASARRQLGRPLLSSAVSLSESMYYPTATDAVLSPEPRFHSAPGRLEDIFSATQESHISIQQQQQYPVMMNRPGTLQHAPGSRALDRRTLSVGDVHVFNGSLPHQQSVGGYRKLPDTAGWDVAPGSAAEAASAPAPQRYKTELCRPFEENGTCRYGAKCQFAHGRAELRNVARHPKYKTEMCRTFHTTGYCPYGPRCHFIHNDEAIMAPDQPMGSSHQPLSRQSSTPVMSGTVEHATAIQKDIERRRSQLMQLHLQTNRRRQVIDELSDEVEPTADWSNVVIDRRQAGFSAGHVSSAVQPLGWPAAVSSSSSSSPLLSSSSPASSPVSSSSVADHVIPYVVEPPPGLPIPQSTADVFLAGNRCSPRSTGGCSPTADMTSSSIGGASFEPSPTSASTSVAYHQMVAAHALTAVPPTGHRNSTRRPLLPANSLPGSFFSDDLDRQAVADIASILASGTSAARFQNATDSVLAASLQQRHLADRELSPCGNSEVGVTWLGSSVSERRAAFSTASTWARQSVDENSSGASFDDSEKADVQQMMASLSPNQLVALVKFVKTYAPASTTDVVPAAPVAPPPAMASSSSSSNAWKYGRSMSVADPSTTTSRQVDGHSWAYRQAMTNSPNFAVGLASNRAAGVCG